MPWRSERCPCAKSIVSPARLPSLSPGMSPSSTFRKDGGKMSSTVVQGSSNPIYSLTHSLARSLARIFFIIHSLDSNPLSDPRVGLKASIWLAERVSATHVIGCTNCEARHAQSSAFSEKLVSSFYARRRQT